MQDNNPTIDIEEIGNFDAKIIHKAAQSVDRPVFHGTIREAAIWLRHQPIREFGSWTVLLPNFMDPSEFKPEVFLKEFGSYFNEPAVNANEKVNHPAHYNKGKYEVIKVIEDWKLNFHLGNVIKCIARAEHMGRNVEDLEKAAWYLNREIQRLKGEVEK